MPTINQGWAFVSGSNLTAGGSDRELQFNNGGSLAGDSKLKWLTAEVLAVTGTVETVGNVSASVNISASAFYGDGANLTGLTASAVEVADGPEFSIQFRKDDPISGEISGSADLMWITGSTDYLHVTGAVKVAGFISASTSVSASEYYIQDGNSIYFGTGDTYKITRNGTNLDINSGNSIVLNAGGKHVSASTNLSASSFYGIDAYLTGDLNVCEGTASITNLSGCSPIFVHSPMTSSQAISSSGFYGSSLKHVDTLTLSSSATITLDADGGSVLFKDGTSKLILYMNNAAAPALFDSVGGDIGFSPNSAGGGGSVSVTGSLTASVNISASAFYGDEAYISASVANGSEIYFGSGTNRSIGTLREEDEGDDFLVVGHNDGAVVLSGSTGIEFVADTSEGVGSYGAPFFVYATQAGDTVVAKMTHQGEVSASTSISGSEYYIQDGNSIYFGTGDTYKITRNGTNLDINAGDSIVFNAGSGHVSASTNFSASAFYTAGDIYLGDNQTIYFEDDLGTYIESDTADRLRFVVGANQMLLLDEDEDRVNIGFGNKLAVGLGNNSTPDATVHVSGTTGGLFLVEGAPWGHVLGVSGSGLVTVTGSIETIGDISASTNISASAFYGDGANLTNLANTGPFTVLDGSNAYTTSSLNIGGTTGMDKEGVQVVVSGTLSSSVNVSASAFYVADLLGTTVYSKNTIVVDHGDMDITSQNASITTQGNIVLDGKHNPGNYAINFKNDGTSFGYIASGSINDQSSLQLWSEGINGAIEFKTSKGMGNTQEMLILDPATTVATISGSEEPSGGGLLRISGDHSDDILFVSGSGIVGIGTAEPSASLHVSSSADASGLLRVDGAVPAWDNPILYVSGSGQVGIGTDSPSFLLHISGSNSTARAFVASDNAAIDILPSNGPAINFGTPADSDAYMKIGTFSSRNQIWLNNAAYDFQISASVGGIGYYFDQSLGRVGIGTNAPGRQFEIYNKTSAVMKFEAADHSGYSIGSDGYGFIIYDDDTTGGGTPGYVFTIAEGTGRRGYVGIGNGLTSPNARLHVSSSEEPSTRGILRVDGDASDGILFVTGSGKVGIGTTTPDATLTVFGSASFSSSAGSTPGFFDLYLGANAAETGTRRIGTVLSDDIGDYLGIVNTNGSILLTASNGVEIEAGGQESEGLSLLGTNLKINETTEHDAATTFQLNASNGQMFTSGSVGVGCPSGAPVLALDVHYTASTLRPEELAANTGGGEVVYFGTASADLSPGALYYLDEQYGWMTADAALTGSGPGVGGGQSQLLGIALGRKPGSSGMLTRGFFNVSSYFSSSFVTGSSVYIQSSSVQRTHTEGGYLSSSAPTGSNSYVRVVGYAISGSVIYFNPSSTFVELAESEE